MGNLLPAVFHAADIADTMGGAAMLKKLREKYPAIRGICGDAGYRGTFVLKATELGFTVDISERIKPVFEILPKRWRVERTFSWMNNSRRLSRDYEINIESAEAMTLISHITESIVKRHGGALHMGNNPATGGGLVTIELPVSKL